MKGVISLFLSLFIIASLQNSKVESRKARLLYVTVASKETDGYRRFIRSARVNGIEPMVLGLGKPWLGGDMNHPGGGYKINLLKQGLAKYKDESDLVVVFSDSYDVIITSGQEEILKKFYSFNANIVFSSEEFCWPDKSLKDQYPSVLLGYPYLNSGGFMGYAPYIYKMLSKDVQDKDDDQLYYTKIYTDSIQRKMLNIKLDSQAKIFQNLNGITDDVALDFKDDETRLINTVYKTTPVIIHGNGPSKTNLNSLGNYLAKSWVQSKGCLNCNDGRIDITQKKDSEVPMVLVAIFVDRPTPFLQEMLEKVTNLNYPMSRLYIFVYNNVAAHEEFVQEWIDLQDNKKYIDVKYISSSDNVKEFSARELAVEKCLAVSCDVYFNVNSEVHLDDPDILGLLISYNRSVLAPIVTRVGKLWATFWGAVTSDGFYARSSDYMQIVNNERRGIWNVPYIYGIFIIWRHILEDPEKKPNFVSKLQDVDIAMTTNFRKRDVFMYAVNLDDNYGHLVDNEAVSTDHLHNDLWQVAANPIDWAINYLHPGYYEALQPDFVNEMACNDVYWLPLFSEQFCKEMIETMEHFGKWSGGSHEDLRISGGYENVPTDDIHFHQVGYEQEWLHILKDYVKPLAEKIFKGYNSPAKSDMSFVVKYQTHRQSSLRPHHDSSTYTINVGLNKPGIDYKGGGAHFIRQNCSVTATKVGWALMHPGRLTHYHEGLPTTDGTRYIIVSFIDP